MQEKIKKVKNIFSKYDIELEEKELEIFANFLQIFMEKNWKINLSSIREEKDIILKHFLDSVILNIFLEFEQKATVLDLGTGWWFPLIPLSIINNKVEFIWIDSVWKKLKAVKEFVQKLWLKNVKTINARAEELGQNIIHRENYDYVVSRATAYFPVLLEYAIPLMKVGAIFCAYKLEDKEELKSIKKALTKLNAKILKVKNYEIQGQKRVIVFIEKLKTTNKKYPRKVWIPNSKPIV